MGTRERFAVCILYHSAGLYAQSTVSEVISKHAKWGLLWKMCISDLKTSRELASDAAFANKSEQPKRSH